MFAELYMALFAFFGAQSVERIQPPEPLNSSPVIGILTHPNAPFLNGTHIGSSYVKFVESGGARVVPVRSDLPLKDLEELFWQLNGLLFTGGMAEFWESDPSSTELSEAYGKPACFLYNLTKKANDQGIYFPLWGTCLGFEMIHICEHNERSTIEDFDGEPRYHQKIDITREGKQSYMFNGVNKQWGHETLQLLEKEELGLFAHHLGVSPSAYDRSVQLQHGFDILGTSQDKSGKTLVALVEHKQYPIFGSMFHPERNLFEWGTEQIPHSYHASTIALYFSTFFVEEARRNTQDFTREDLLIYHFTPIYMGGIYETIYVF